MFQKTSFHHFVLFLVWILAIALRLQNFFLLPIDAHAMRQTDTESVAYYFVHSDPNLLHAQASLIRPQTNIHGYFFLEFPVYEYLISIAYRIFGSSIVVARIFNLLLFSVSYYLIYKFIETFLNKQIALWSTIIYTLIPSSIFFFGHAIHPDLFAITTVLGSLYLLSLEKRNFFKTFLAGVLLATAVGTRPFILMALPSLLVVTYFKKGKWWEYLVLAICSVSIYGFWSWWQKFFPEADHSWQYWTLQGREALYTVAGWKHLLWRNTSGEVVGRVASGLAATGLVALCVQCLKLLNVQSAQLTQFFQTLLKKPAGTSPSFKIFSFSLPWLAVVPLYWYIAPAGNAAHQYYANVFVLPLILLAAYGTHSVLSLIKQNQIRLGVGLTIFIALLLNGFRTSSYFYNDIARQDYIEIAKQIEDYVPANEKVVYLATNNSLPFSLAHRQGWMLGGEPTDVGATADAVLNMKKYGATHFIYAYENTDLPIEEVEKLRNSTESIYKSDTVEIFKIKQE